MYSLVLVKVGRSVLHVLFYMFCFVELCVVPAVPGAQGTETHGFQQGFQQRITRLSTKDRCIQEKSAACDRKFGRRWFCNGRVEEKKVREAHIVGHTSLERKAELMSVDRRLALLQQANTVQSKDSPSSRVAGPTLYPFLSAEFCCITKK